MDALGNHGLLHRDERQELKDEGRDFQKERKVFAGRFVGHSYVRWKDFEESFPDALASLFPNQDIGRTEPSRHRGESFSDRFFHLGLRQAGGNGNLHLVPKEICESTAQQYIRFTGNRASSGGAMFVYGRGGEGRPTLDQPIADILPAFAKMKVQNTPDGSLTDVRDAKTLITVRHLPTPTAGLGYNIIQKGPLRDAYNAAGILGGQVSRLPIPGLPQSTPAPSLAEFADRLAKLPLVYEPGTQWSYSVGLDLMGRVIEVVSGQPFDAFLKARIFDPLGMTSTGFQVAAADVGRFSTNYAPFGGALLPIDPATSSIYLDKPPIPYGGGGLVASARDYDRFLAMLLGEGETGGVRILKPETARLAMSNLLPEGATTKNSFVEGEGFGAGGRVSLASSPTGEGVYGWGGAAGTIAFVDRTRGSRVGGYAQYMPAEALPFQRDFGKAFYKDVMV